MDAISRQRQAATTVDALVAKVSATDFPEEADDLLLHWAVRAEWQAAATLAATVPTTPEGRQALERWLRDDLSRLAVYHLA